MSKSQVNSYRCCTNVFRAKLLKKLNEKSREVLLEVNCRYDSSTTAPGLIRGIDHLRDPRLNKGLAFTLQERQALGLHGILAPHFYTQEQQVEICTVAIGRYAEALNKYLYLVELMDTNERLFYSLLNTDIEKYMPIIYTPTVGLACQKFGLAYRRPRGLFISIHDKGHIKKVIGNWPETDVRAICFTDGERILGLGDLGAFGMGIPVGKLALYTALASIKPHQCLPITLDVGTNNKALIEDPMYIGLRRERARGQEYDDFIDEFMFACTERYGPRVLLQFEDFSYANATPLLERYRDKFCTFNDDIQGTASVAVAGLLAATRVTKKKMSENTIMFLGAGSAATGIANLSVLAMEEEGLSKKDAEAKIYLFDIDGLLSTKRDGGVPPLSKQYGKDVEPSKNFEECVKKYKPSCLIGCSTVGGSFTPAILKIMAENCERPIIFALSNPTSRAECTAQDAYDHTNGKCIFSSGSPFPPVKFNGKTYKTGQGNNAYIFPGVALGVMATAAYIIPDKLFLAAARSCANFVQESDLNVGRIYPPLSDVRQVSFQIAMDICKICYEDGLATHFPKPTDFKQFIGNHTYNLKYPSYLPEFFDYPAQPNVKLKKIDECYPKIRRQHVSENFVCDFLECKCFFT
ncbi:NADP-dependent malic enzyme-like [Hyposmocoma kahamanoa]|uniref:NADP-dependent malic enzyme-like n=1 Tax=Hyposmocoma kahamanoa TaxID=1477025 RepID=UPI000E6D835E|nr:NADP-dependent malic enzyme-like [Hyposmocoma kahamanoa]